MKTERPIPILLADYQQPNFLIDDVFLDIKLGETSTEVVAKLQIYRNPNAAHPHAALVLNGEQLKTQWVALDGHKLDRKKYTVTKYDLVVSDVDMPRMDGIGLVTLIKTDAQRSHVPVVIVSYKDREEDRLRGLDAGANRYLTKSSFQDDTFLETIVDLIGEPTD